MTVNPSTVRIRRKHLDALEQMGIRSARNGNEIVADELTAPGREFLFSITKQCDDRGWCRKRKSKTMEPFERTFAGRQYTLCPWYPRTNWRTLSTQVAAGVKELLAVQERV